MGILIQTVRVSGFRGLENVEFELGEIIILTGMNNTGKTSLLKAMQIALGNRQFITSDDFYTSDRNSLDRIVIDLLIIPINETAERVGQFEDEWEEVFTVDRVRLDTRGQSFVPLRTVITFDEIKNTYKSRQYILESWPDFKNEANTYWHEMDNGIEKSFVFDEVPFFYMDAQRDILEDMKMRNSYLGKMISKIEYSQEDIDDIEKQIEDLNQGVVNKSEVLSSLKDALIQLNTALDNSSEGVEITPFTKKVRDLNKGLSIYYSDTNESYAMEYHGMGTRSWSSLLILKSFIELLSKKASDESLPFFPIIAIEEPEAHLHPNAQKKLYDQINKIKGQKLISTHSPYIAGSASLSEVRSFYKNSSGVMSGRLNVSLLKNEEVRKIERQVVSSRGELFFAKLIVLFEGETEEQALPILAEEFFEKPTLELGIDFVGVGGHGNYTPFLIFAKSMNIPWVIFSDAEEDTVTKVKKQVNDCTGNEENIVFLTNENDFEKELIADGFSDQIKKAIVSLEIPNCHNEKHEEAKKAEIEAYSKDSLLQYLKAHKTSCGPAIAEILKEDGNLPRKVQELFNKIKSIIEPTGQET